MIKRFLAWLKSIYFKPAQAETQTPEESAMSDIPLDVAAQPAVEVVTKAIPDSEPVLDQAAADQSPSAEAKAGVADLDAALNFIESGVAQLGDAAKNELKALAKKYL